jgi:hypothetical protein
MYPEPARTAPVAAASSLMAMLSRVVFLSSAPSSRLAPWIAVRATLVAALGLLLDELSGHVPEQVDREQAGQDQRQQQRRDDDTQLQRPAPPAVEAQRAADQEAAAQPRAASPLRGSSGDGCGGRSSAGVRRTACWVIAADPPDSRRRGR